MNTHRATVSRDPLGTTTARSDADTRADAMRAIVAGLFDSAPWRPFSLCFPIEQNSEQFPPLFEAAPGIPNPMASTWSHPLASGARSPPRDFVFDPFGCDDDIETSPPTFYTYEGLYAQTAPIIDPVALAQSFRPLPPWTSYTPDGLHSPALERLQSPPAPMSDFQFDPFGDFESSSPAASPRVFYDSTHSSTNAAPSFDAPALQLRFTSTPELELTPPLSWSYGPDSGVDSPSTSPDSSVIVVDTGDARTYTEMRVLAPKPRALMRPVAQVFELQACVERRPSPVGALEELACFLGDSEDSEDQHTAGGIFSQEEGVAGIAAADKAGPSAQLVADMKLLLSTPMGPQKDELARRLFGWKGPSSVFGQQYVAPTLERSN